MRRRPIARLTKLHRLGQGGLLALPVADFAADRTDISVDTSATFTSTNAGGAGTYAWEKNRDGAGWVPFEGTPTAANPTETFGIPGTYAIRLTITNALGSDVESKAAYLLVSTNALVWSVGNQLSAGKLAKVGDNPDAAIELNSVNRRGEDVNALMLSTFSVGQVFTVTMDADPTAFWTGTITEFNDLTGRISVQLGGSADGTGPIEDGFPCTVTVLSP